MSTKIIPRSYGSIPHLLGSKLGEGDHHIHEGQHKICTKKGRDWRDVVVVQYKLDGSNVSVLRRGKEVIALTRSGYSAETSPYEQHHYFARYVENNKKMFLRLLEDGQRLCGEWILQAHGIRYMFDGVPFAPFDIMEGNDRLNFWDFSAQIAPFKDCFCEIQTLHVGNPIGINDIVEEQLKKAVNAVFASHEGFIYRVYRNRKFDFIAKWVRPDFVPGKYLPEISGAKEVWNFDPKKI